MQSTHIAPLSLPWPDLLQNTNNNASVALQPFPPQRRPAVVSLTPPPSSHPVYSFTAGTGQKSLLPALKSALQDERSDDADQSSFLGRSIRPASSPAFGDGGVEIPSFDRAVMPSIETTRIPHFSLGQRVESETGRQVLDAEIGREAERNEEERAALVSFNSFMRDVRGEGGFRVDRDGDVVMGGMEV